MYKSNEYRLSATTCPISFLKLSQFGLQESANHEKPQSIQNGDRIYQLGSISYDANAEC